MKNDYIKIDDIKQKQKLLLYILKNFHDICEKNGLVYNIFGGTMLGAVRHGGIIPWDDDIDVTMPRDDYERFIQVVKEQYQKDFMIHSIEDKNYIYPYAKFGMKKTLLTENVVRDKYNKLTVNIDVFPNDNYPLDISLFKQYEEYERNIIKCAYNTDIMPKKWWKKPFAVFKYIERFLVRIRGVYYYLEKQERLFKEAKSDEKYILCQGAGWGEKGKLEKTVYYDRMLYSFNDLKVWGIKNYDKHLSSLYGDYMTPPPEEKRICPHSNSFLIEKEIYDKVFK